MAAHERGFQLVELLVAASVLAVGLLLVVPPLDPAASGLVTRLAAEEVVSVLRQARAYAHRHAEKVGVKFHVAGDGRVRWALYRDGDDDGVRSADIASGVDPRLAPPRALAHFGRRVRLGFPPGPMPLDPSDPRRRLAGRDDPVRFNRSDIASFSPLEGSTPGSIYLTGGERHLLVVRLYNRTSRAHILAWDAARRRWR
jgi:competence protein ComGC